MSTEAITALREMFSAERPMPTALASKPEPEPEAMPAPTADLSVAGLVTNPQFRFNGSTLTPPWNLPEEELFNWLLTVEVEAFDETIMSPVQGRFVGLARRDDIVRPLTIRFAGIGRSHVIETYGAELGVFAETDLLVREVASYEVAKALGCEDLASPVCIRDFDTVALVSDASREAVARAMKCAVDAVDGILGTAATVQISPKNMVNFSEHWATLGVSNKERWANASDQLRFSIYRTYFMDFVLGTVERSAFSLMYNMNADRVFVPDLSMSLPHLGYTTEKYMQMRYRGWGRTSAVSMTDSAPPTSYEITSLFADLDQKYIDEAVLVAKQMVERMTDAMCAHLAACLVEYSIPVECIGSLFTRLCYLALTPGSVIKQPSVFIRNICMPVRGDLQISDPRIASCVEFANSIIQTATGEMFDMLDVLLAKTPEGVEFLM